MNRFVFLPLLLTTLLTMACTKDETIVDPPATTTADGVYVVNEGNFQRGNSSLSWFDAEAAATTNGIFRAVNGRDLGDVGNDIVVRSDNAYIVVNNSDRVEVITLGEHASAGTWQLKEGSSPRQLVFDDNGIAYVSCLLGNSVQVIDTEAGTLGPEISVGANPEGMAIANGKLFVANSGFGAGNTVSVVDLASYTVSSTITVGDNPGYIEEIGNGTLAVLCTGAYNDFNDPNDDTPGMLYIVDPQSATITDSLILGGHPQRLSIDTQQRMAYTVDGDVVRIDLGSMSSERFIAGFYYNVLVDARAQRLYVTDPLDFQQAGKLLVFDMEGQKLSEHSTGIIPGAMAVVKKD